MTKTVTVVGVGALGSHLVQFLRSEDILLRVIDFDRVEQKNICSQFHCVPSRGKKKVDSLAQAMQMLFGVRITTISHKLTEDNVDVVLSGDVVVDCLDNAEARHLVQEWTRAHSIPCVHGALAQDASFGRIVWDENFSIDTESSSGAPTCEGGEHLPFIATTAGYLARSVQRFLFDAKKIGYELSPSGTVAT